MFRADKGLLSDFIDMDFNIEITAKELQDVGLITLKKV